MSYSYNNKYPKKKKLSMVAKLTTLNVYGGPGLGVELGFCQSLTNSVMRIRDKVFKKQTISLQIF